MLRLKPVRDLGHRATLRRRATSLTTPIVGTVWEPALTMSGLWGGAGVACLTPASAAAMEYAYISRTQPNASLASSSFSNFAVSSTHRGHTLAKSSKRINTGALPVWGMSSGSPGCSVGVRSGVMHVLTKSAVNVEQASARVDAAGQLVVTNHISHI